MRFQKLLKTTRVHIAAIFLGIMIGVFSYEGHAQQPETTPPHPANPESTTSAPGNTAPSPANNAPPPGGTTANPPAPAPVSKDNSQPSPVPPPAKTGAISPGVPATVMSADRVDGVLGKKVQSHTGEDMGRIVDILIDRSAQVQGAVIDFGGFLGVGSRQIAVAWNALRFPDPEKPDVLMVDFTKDQLRVAPAYKAGEQIVLLGPPAPATTEAPPLNTTAAAPSPVAPIGAQTKPDTQPAADTQPKPESPKPESPKPESPKLESPKSESPQPEPQAK